MAKPIELTYPFSQSHPMPFSAIANLDLYRQNPFRVTGLPIDASVKEIARLTDRLKTLAELGEAGNLQQSAFTLDSAPTVDQIREAAQCLKEPELRIANGFFWFWPANGFQPPDDPAMQALERGDQNQTCGIWLERECDPIEGFVAKHNLAVMYHLTAIDWTQYQITTEVDAEQETKIRSYWKEALSRWTDLASDERMWDVVKNRIRELNDPRITTDLARRMSVNIKQAIVRINADAALKFAEMGRFEPAGMHLELISEFEPEAERSRKVIDSALATKVEVIRLCLKDTKNKSEPKELLAATRRLIQEVKLQLPLFDLFYPKDAHQRTELFDEAASACIGGIVTYQKATGDDENVVVVLREVLDFAQSTEVRERAAKNIEIGLGNLAFAKIKPLFEKLKRIADRTDLPKQKLSSIQADIIPEFSGLVQNTSDVSEQITEFSNGLALALQAVSLEAWHQHKDKQTATEACELASRYAIDSELKAQISTDQNGLMKEIKADSQAAYIGKLLMASVFIMPAIVGGFVFVRFLRTCLNIHLAAYWEFLIGGLVGGVFSVFALAGVGYICNRKEMLRERADFIVQQEQPKH